MITVIDNEGLRLDSYLAQELNLSRSKVQKLIKDGKVIVNGKEASSSYSVKLNDEIMVNDEMDYEINVEAENIPLDIIYEDEDLIIINKKSGMVVHPAPGHYTGTLVNALLYKYGELAGEKFRPGIVHRLDKDTSGLMIVAKNEEMLEKLSTMISEKQVERKYLAIINGVIKHDTGTIDAPIGRDLNNRQKMAVTEINSKDAITHFTVLERFENNTLIECKLETGRTHQIRVHMASIQHPLLGDDVYGPSKSNFKLQGQALHARVLGFIHPTTKKYVEFEAPLPEYFERIIKKLKQC